MYRIYVRDRNLNRVGEVDDYSKLTYTLNFNDVGKWILELADGTRAAELLKSVRAQGMGLGGIIVERLGQVVFSRSRRNLKGYQYVAEAPEANFFVGGGTGEDTLRNFAYLGDEPSRELYGTIEDFDDQRNISDQTELIASLQNKLIEQTEKTELKIQPLNVEPTLYMRDFQLGDKVTVEVQGEIIQDLIRSITVEVNADDEKIMPVVGTPGVGTRFRLFDQYRNLEGRLGQLERR